MNLINHERIIEFNHLPYQYRRNEVKPIIPKQIVSETLEDTNNLSLIEQLALFEKQTIQQYLTKNDHHITNTATALGISRQSLQYRMKRLNIHVPRV